MVQLRHIVHGNRWLYAASTQLRGSNLRRLRIGQNTDVVIDGFPRSANTYAVVGFNAAQRLPVTISHHTHAPATLISAARKSIPTLLLIREPRGASLSYSIYNATSVEEALREWVWFYSCCRRIVDKVAIGYFDEIVSDVNSVARLLNAKFGTSFDAAAIDDAWLLGVRDAIKGLASSLGYANDKLALPSKDRARLSQEASVQYDALEGLVEKAQALYQWYCAR